MFEIKYIKLKVENYNLRKENNKLNKKLKNLEDESKSDLELINYMSNELMNYYNNFDRLTDEIRSEIQQLRIDVNNL